MSLILPIFLQFQVDSRDVVYFCWMATGKMIKLGLPAIVGYRVYFQTVGEGHPFRFETIGELGKEARVLTLQ